MSTGPWVRAITLAAMTVLATACSSSSELTAASSCRDFINATKDDQDAAVNRIATDLRAPSVVTPLGRPNIDFACAAAPGRTLDSVIGDYAGGRRSATDASDGDIQTADDAALASIRQQTTLPAPKLEPSGGLELQGPAAEIEMTVDDAIRQFLRPRATLLPDDVSIDTFIRLLPKALIIAAPEASRPYRDAKVVRPDDTVDNVVLTVVFLPEGVSKAKYMAKLHSRFD